METQINYRQLFEEQREQNKQLQLLIVQLQQQIEQLLRAQFGKKSERKPKVRVPKPNAVPSSVTFSHKDKTLTQGRALPGSFERVDIHHDVQEERKQCAHCNTRLHEIKAIERELWAYRPGSLYVKKHIRHRYACRSCQQTIVTAKMPIQPIEKGVADSSLLAQVIVDKYQDHLPLYRQEQRWLRNGAALSRQSLCDWAMGSAKWLGYLVDEMRKDVLLSKKINSDDTPFPILAPGKTHTGRLWVYIGDDKNTPPIVVYDYTQTRASQGPLNFLKDYRGFLQADAYAGYDRLYVSGNIIEVGCMAHCRRKFYEAQQSSGGSKEISLSQSAIEFIGQLYGVEHYTKPMTANERYYYRKRYAWPILKKFYRFLKCAKPKAYPKSLLGKAIAYALNHWRALCHYCRDGILDIDNNAAERAIKPFVIGRKNYLFAGSHEGAKAAAIIYSIIETCKMWGINTYDYLTDVLARLPNTLNKDLRLLLPYHWKPTANN